MRRFAKIKAQSEAAKSWVIEIAYAYGSDVRIIDEQGLEFEPISLSAFNTNYEVSTKEILRQGHYLQNLGMTIVMSRSTWYAFQGAVRGRQEYAEKYAREQPDHKGNAGHVYFLEVLRRVKDMLSGFIQVQKTNRAKLQRH
mgnify:CR=1 FL=1